MKKISIIIPLLLHMQTNCFDLYGRSFLSPRSQSTNAARDLVGWHNLINMYDQQRFYYALSLTPEYTQSLRADRITQYFFSVDSLNISGSQVVNRGENDILADYFGLSPAFNSIVDFDPRIKTGIISLNGYLGYKNYYFRFLVPGVMTRWNLNLMEEVLNSGSGTQFPADYMSTDALTAPVNSFKDAIKGGVTFGDVSEGLKYGKIDGSQHTNALSEVQLVAGWNPLNRENGHFGFNIRTALPTGTRPDSTFLFEPVAGNGKHWEFGVGFTGRVLIWDFNDGERQVSFFADANFTHLFKSRQTRSFDFLETACPKETNFGSRYILAKKFDSEGAYTGESLPTINFTTLKCDISVDIQADLVFMFGYTHEGLTVDIGYNGWIRSKEKIDTCERFPANTYGFKGIQNVRESDVNSVATESIATLHGNEFDDQILVIDANSPVFLNPQMLDLSSASTPLAITHKIFAHIHNTWHVDEQERIKPFCGIGGEIEFEGTNERFTRRPDKNTITQWGVWAKGGIAY